MNKSMIAVAIVLVLVVNSFASGVLGEEVSPVVIEDSFITDVRSDIVISFDGEERIVFTIGTNGMELFNDDGKTALLIDSKGTVFVNGSELFTDEELKAALLRLLSVLEILGGEG